MFYLVFFTLNAKNRKNLIKICFQKQFCQKCLKRMRKSVPNIICRLCLCLPHSAGARFDLDTTDAQHCCRQACLFYCWLFCCHSSLTGCCCCRRHQHQHQHQHDHHHHHRCCCYQRQSESLCAANGSSQCLPVLLLMCVSVCKFVLHYSGLFDFFYLLLFDFSLAFLDCFSS